MWYLRKGAGEKAVREHVALAGGGREERRYVSMWYLRGEGGRKGGT